MKCKKEVLRKIAKSRNRTRILTWRNFYKISKDLKKKQEIFQTPPNLSVSTKNQKTSKVQSLPNLSPNEVQNNSITWTPSSTLSHFKSWGLFWRTVWETKSSCMLTVSLNNTYFFVDSAWLLQWAAWLAEGRRQIDPEIEIYIQQDPPEREASRTFGNGLWKEYWAVVYSNSVWGLVDAEKQARGKQVLEIVLM